MKSLFRMILLLLTVVLGISGSSYKRARAEPLVLTYVANAGVLVSCGESKVLIDGLFDKPNPEYRAPASDVLDKIMKGVAPFDGVDLVLVTHNHPDHFDAALAVRFLETLPEPLFIAPADAVGEMRKAAADWPKIEPRIISLDLKVGEKEKKELARIPVTAFRTLHSGDQESPLNLMYLLDIDGWRVFHEGDSNGKPEVYQGFELGGAPVDLAMVHFWFPLDPDCSQFLQEIIKPEHIALTHLPVRLEGDAPGKIDRVRQYYKDIFLLLPGMPPRVFRKQVSDEPVSALADDAQTVTERFFGKAPPGLEPVTFCPEILTAEKHPHGQLAFSPDGKDVFWSAMLQDGPDQTIFCSVFDGKTFSRPAVAPFAAASGNGGPAFSADGRRLFFSAILASSGKSSERPTAICHVDRTGSGWTKPTPIESTVDTRMTKGQVSVARNGNVYFSGRVKSEKNPGLYICRYSEGNYVPPEKIGGPLDSSGPLVDPWVDPDERFMLMSCLPEDGASALTDIGISFRLADGKWSKPVPLSGGVNTPAYERFASISASGQHLFFIRSYSQGFVGDQAHFYWVDAKVLEGLRQDEPTGNSAPPGTPLKSMPIWAADGQSSIRIGHISTATGRTVAFRAPRQMRPPKDTRFDEEDER